MLQAQNNSIASVFPVHITGRADNESDFGSYTQPWWSGTAGDAWKQPHREEGRREQTDPRRKVAADEEEGGKKKEGWERYGGRQSELSHNRQSEARSKIS